MKISNKGEEIKLEKAYLKCVSYQIKLQNYHIFLRKNIQKNFNTKLYILLLY